MAPQPQFKKRTVQFQVICPALSRNGTDSMRKALEILGVGRTFHGFRLAEEDVEAWLDLVDRKYPRSNDPKDARPISAEEFDRVIGDYSAVTDMPAAAFWREIMDAYPDAKVVLVERTVEDWYPSFYQVVVQGMMSRKGQIFANPWVAWFVGERKIEMLFRVFLQYFNASNRRQVAENARTVYKKHNEAIREACKREGRALLEYRLGDGWEPLCDFLHVDVPKDVQFPRGNEAKVMSQLTNDILTKRVLGFAKMVVIRAGIVAPGLSFVWMAFQR